MVTETIHCSLEEHFRDKTTTFARIGTEVNAREWHLSTGAGVHSIKVMHETFHSLKSLFFSISVCVFYDGFWKLQLLNSFFVAIVKTLWDFNLEIFAGKVLIFLNIIA